MKVLFAVNNEEISESIVKKYQKEYKQIISYKNVYYFNAILKELQKDKTYDRVVISEDLEAFTHTQYDQIDKFIFEKLDSISDEASNIKGNDTPIILICSDRRAKSEPMLVKLFGIGIYNAIIGNDRSVDEVCRLINRPRVKKEAKTYYKIDTEDVGYQAENENDVSEMEIQNIVAHYKRLGKNEDRYVDSFNNIAAQYNDTQLRIITKFLPLNVRAVLEERSQKYQQIMSFNNSVSDKLRKTKNDTEDGPSQILLKSKNRDTVLSKPVVIPSAVNMSGTKKLSKTKQEESKQQKQPVKQQTAKQETTPIIEGLEDFEDFKTITQEPVQEAKQTPKEVNQEELIIEGLEELAKPTAEPVQPVKRGRGRPRKNPIPIVEVVEVKSQPEPEVEDFVLPGIQPQEVETENFLPGFEEIETIEPKAEPINMEQQTFLPGFEEEPEEFVLPGLEEVEEPEIIVEEEPEEFEPVRQQEIEPQQVPQNLFGIETMNRQEEPEIRNNYSNEERNQNNYEDEEIEEIDLTDLLTPDKKIATFVGTSKNGTSFIVNNVAQILSSIGVDVAILDTTQNRNSYYIYTKNEPALREVATHSIEKLSRGVASGIGVNKNLTVYTSLPGDNDKIDHVDKILETLLQKHSLVLIDTDFKTPLRYFKQSQEIYLVQSMDILTIQALTGFLKELKMKNILEERKLRIVLNKSVKIRGIKATTIIGGMAFYNDPDMSFMTELFDRDRIKYVSIPFEEETYIRYLQGIIECDIELKGYSKMFLQSLRELGNMVYPIVTSSATNRKNYQPPSTKKRAVGNFSSSMNDTLNKMKNF